MSKNDKINSPADIQGSFSLSPYRNKVDGVGPDPVTWLRMGQFVAAVTGVSRLMTWSKRYIGKSLSVAKDRVLPNLWYRQELQKMFDRLEALEKELQQLKDSRPGQLNSYPAASPGTCPGCRCLQCGKSVAMAPVYPSLVTSSTRVVPAPPPPPPPPLPPLPSATPTPIRKGSRKRRISSNEETALPTVTLEQLQQVKLRKADPRPPLKSEDSSITTPEVDLRHRVLKKALGQEIDKENIHGRIACEVLNFKGGLKKTTMKRSPGGTPISKRKWRGGKGLSPMMEKALRKKFMSVNDSRSSSDSSMGESPSPGRSPLANTPDNSF